MSKRDGQRSSSSPLIESIYLKALLFAVFYFILAKCGALLSLKSGNFVNFWLPSGFYVAILLLNKKRHWPVLILSAIIANNCFDLLNGKSFEVGLLFSLANSLDAIIGAWLVLLLIKQPVTLRTLREVVVFVICSAGIATAVGATIGATVITTLLGGVSFGQTWAMWWSGDALGVLLLAPLAVVWLPKFNRPGEWKFSAQVGLAFALFALLSLATVFVFNHHLTLPFPLKYILIPVVLLIAIRFGLYGVTMANLFVALISARLAALDYHDIAVAHLPEINQIISLQLFLGIIALVGLVTAAILSEREQANSDLREEKSKLKKLIESTKTIPWEYDIKRDCYTFVGQQIGDLLGVPPTAWQSLADWTAMIHPEDREESVTFSQAETKQGRDHVFEYRMITSTGEIRWFLDDVAVQTMKGEPVRLSGFILDITARKKVELELKELQELYVEAEEIGKVGGWEVDILTKELKWTKEVYRIHELDPSTKLTLETGINFYTPSSQSIIERVVQRAIEFGEPFEVELEILTAKGNLKSIHSIGKRHKDQQKVGGFVQDITERKQTEEEKKLLESQLLQSQKMEAMGNLVGGIAHNFNNALAGITGNLYLAKKGAEELPKVVEKLTRAEKLAFQTGETIQQLLSFTRKGIVQKKSIPVAPFLKETIKLHQMTIPENISLQVEVEDLTLVVNGDVSQLQQVLLNLIINARDAVKDVKHPSITIKLSKFYADKDYLKKHPYVKDQNFVCISVRDNGCGIAEQDLQRIFEPFFTTKGVGRGTGLGLSMVFGAIKSHGGHIEVNSVPDKGSLFEIYLPIHEAVEAVLPKNTEDRNILGNREKILLVDDNEMVLEIGKALLEELNYKVLTAKDGQEAVATYRAFKDVIDMLVLDVVMPKMGGVEALRIIRQEDPEVKAIFCTGYDKLNVVTEDEGISLESVITKPFSISELSQKLKSTLG